MQMEKEEDKVCVLLCQRTRRRWQNKFRSFAFGSDSTYFAGWWLSEAS
jgi:hypothetical protein